MYDGYLFILAEYIYSNVTLTCSEITFIHMQGVDVWGCSK